MDENMKIIAKGDMVDVYRKDDKVIKVFHENSNKTSAMYEALTHSRVEKTGIQMPIIHEISKTNNKWSITMDHVEGKTLYQIMKDDPENILKYIEQMVDLQILIHSKSVMDLSLLKDKLTYLIKNVEEIDDVTQYELLTRLEGMPKHTKLCHCNFSPMNIIINDKGTYVVDWVASAQGNASADIGITYMILCLEFPEAAEKYLDMFCKKTNTKKKYVQDWLPIIAAAKLPNCKPEEKELLLKWIDVVEYE